MSGPIWCPMGRLEELQAFIDAEWSPGHILTRDAELLRWQHRRTDDELSVLVADDDDGRMAGAFGVIPVEFCVHGDRYPGAWTTTWIVRPDQRKNLLGLQLLRRVMDETPGFVGTLGANSTTRRILRALRYDVRDAIPRWILPGSLTALESLLQAAGTEAGPEDWSRWRSAADRVPSAPGLDVLDWSERSADAWDALWGERLSETLVGTWRDAAYLRWRYLDHPRFDYVIRFAAAPGGAVAGLVVFRRQRVRDRPEVVVRIVELLGEPPATEALAAHVAQEARDEEVAFLDFYCTSPRFAGPLETAGFMREGDGVMLPALLQPLDPSRSALTGGLWASEAVPGGTTIFDSDDVYLTRSDCDQDRPN